MRYAVVGLGNIGRKRVAALGERCVATVDPVNADADFRALEDCPPDAYDAAVVAVPNEAKLDLLERLLCLDKHVLVEKPMVFANRRQYEYFQKLAARHGVVWRTGYNHRFEPLVIRLKQQLEANLLGRLYYGRLFYGNGTAGDVAGSWRDQAGGVVDDLVPHLLDLVDYFFGIHPDVFPVLAERHETRSVDHSILATEDRRFVLETSYVSWRNTFSVDLFGERGSLHLAGLCKWGGSQLVTRSRVLPSGIPMETVERAAGADPTWAAEVDHFDSAAPRGDSTASTDWWISSCLLSAGRAG